MCDNNKSDILSDDIFDDLDSALADLADTYVDGGVDNSVSDDNCSGGACKL